MTRPIEIKPVLNGWICNVGCQQVVFTDKKTMLCELDAYYSDPDGVEKRFMSNAVNKVEQQIVNTQAEAPCRWDPKRSAADKSL